MRKFFLTIIIALYMGFALPIYAVNFIKPFVPAPEQVGKGTLKFTFIKIYDALLYAPNGVWDNNKPFALQLQYAVPIKSNRITQQTIAEIEKQGVTDTQKLALWTEKLAAIYPDVRDGISLTGVYTATGDTVFFKNDTPIGTIQDAEFSRLFFDIWLGQNTSAPKLRRALLGIQ